MKRISVLVLLAAIVSFAAVSCKKYEDGPTFSLASKKGRLAGDWTIEKATYVDASGSESDITSSFSYWSKIAITKDGDITITSSGTDYKGTWEFDDKKEKITVNIDGETFIWEITRLKQKELWVKWHTDASSPEYIKFEFKQ